MCRRPGTAQVSCRMDKIVRRVPAEDRFKLTTWALGAAFIDASHLIPRTLHNADVKRGSGCPVNRCSKPIVRQGRAFSSGIASDALKHPVFSRERRAAILTPAHAPFAFLEKKLNNDKRLSSVLF